MGIVHTSRALAERPGRAMSGDGIVTEGFDRLLVHAAKEVPRLVVLAGMFEAEPNVLAKTLPAARDAVAAIAFAARTGTRALALFRFRALAFRLDADIGFESRSLAGRCHL